MLPRFETEAATGPLALGMFQPLDETDCTQRCPAVEVPTAFECAVLIGIVTAHGKTDVFANQYAAVAYLFGIDLGGIFFVVVILFHLFKLREVIFRSIIGKQGRNTVAACGRQSELRRQRTGVGERALGDPPLGVDDRCRAIARNDLHGRAFALDITHHVVVEPHFAGISHDQIYANDLQKPFVYKFRRHDSETLRAVPFRPERGTATTFVADGFAPSVMRHGWSVPRRVFSVSGIFLRPFISSACFYCHNLPVSAKTLYLDRESAF